MNDPNAYKQWNTLRDHESEILQKYSKLISWRTDQLDSVLDIGCAGGDITNDLILPLLPEKFTRLVGVDINENMVQFAQKNYTNSKLSFDVLDLTGDISEFLNVYQEFDHAISFLCLHLIPDQKTALENISKLLKPTGDCLLYIIAEHKLFDVYFHLYDKWKKYLPKVDNFISPYYHRVNAEEMLTNLLKSSGFQTTFVETVKHTVHYNDLNVFKDVHSEICFDSALSSVIPNGLVFSVKSRELLSKKKVTAYMFIAAANRSHNPFISGIPSDLQEEFMDDFVKMALSYNDDNTARGVEAPFQFLIAYASKKGE